MAQYGMGDEATINEVLDDVDTDKVSEIFDFFPSLFFCSYIVLKGFLSSRVNIHQHFKMLVYCVIAMSCISYAVFYRTEGLILTNL